MGGLFSKPSVPAPARMPDSQGPATLEAQAVKQRQIMARSGRTATNLTGGDAAFSNSLLGQ